MCILGSAVLHVIDENCERRSQAVGSYPLGSLSKNTPTIEGVVNPCSGQRRLTKSAGPTLFYMLLLLSIKTKREEVPKAAAPPRTRAQLPRS